MSNEETALQTASLSPEDIQAVLAGQGVIDEESEGFGAIRMKTTGNTFQTEDDVWVYNPKTDEPAFTARLMSAPVQYQAKWFTQAEAEKAGRPEIADKFCKSHYDIPTQARERSETGASCRACPFNPFGEEQKRCQWRGDLSFQIIPEDGQLTGDEPIHMISLPVTGMIEWKGTRRAPTEGSATKKNFMYKLAELSIRQAEDWGVNERQAIIVGIEALNEGMVAAEFRLVSQSDEDRGRTWSVVSLTPIHVQKPEPKDAPALEAGEATNDSTDANEFDDLPF